MSDRKLYLGEKAFGVTRITNSEHWVWTESPVEWTGWTLTRLRWWRRPVWSLMKALARLAVRLRQRGPDPSRQRNSIVVFGGEGQANL